MMDSVPNFTPRAQEAIKKSREIALEYNVKVIKLEHLLLGLLCQSRGLLRECFNLSGYDIDAFYDDESYNFDNIGEDENEQEESWDEDDYALIDFI